VWVVLRWWKRGMCIELVDGLMDGWAPTPV
jgi:hypothetical protein